MKFSVLSAIAATAVSVFPSATLSTTDAFTPKHTQKPAFFHHHATGSATIAEVDTKPIPGMKPGTSGLRKKVEVWQAIDEKNLNYVENFIQSLLDTAQRNNGGKMLDT